MYITLRDGESVTIQRPCRQAVITLVANGGYSGTGISTSVRAAGSLVPEPDRSIVRVDVEGATYCYHNVHDLDIGDRAVVVLPGGAPYFADVIGFGKGNYAGPVYKDAHRVPAQD